MSVGPASGTAGVLGLAAAGAGGALGLDPEALRVLLFGGGPIGGGAAVYLFLRGQAKTHRLLQAQTAVGAKAVRALEDLKEAVALLPPAVAVVKGEVEEARGELRTLTGDMKREHEEQRRLAMGTGARG